MAALAEGPEGADHLLKTAWDMGGEKASVAGRWHDNRHTLITEPAESGAGDETIMEIACHLSLYMLSRYSHICTEATRRAPEGMQQNRELPESASSRYASRRLPNGTAR